jgi:hypothetical protein
MTPKKRAPLEEFNAEIVQVPLRGLLTNMDRELERRLKTAGQSHDRKAEHSLSLLLIMLRFTSNSYEAICFLLSTTDDNPKRKSQFALVVPPANRQLLDLLFTIVYIMDDFPARSLAYELLDTDSFGKNMTNSTAGLVRTQSGRRTLTVCRNCSG